MATVTSRSRCSDIAGKAMMQQKPLCIVDSELSSEFFGRTFLVSCPTTGRRHFRRREVVLGSSVGGRVKSTTNRSPSNSATFPIKSGRM